MTKTRPPQLRLPNQEQLNKYSRSCEFHQFNHRLYSLGNQKIFAWNALNQFPFRRRWARNTSSTYLRVTKLVRRVLFLRQCARFQRRWGSRSSPIQWYRASSTAMHHVTSPRLTEFRVVSGYNFRSIAVVTAAARGVVLRTCGQFSNAMPTSSARVTCTPHPPR